MRKTQHSLPIHPLVGTSSYDFGQLVKKNKWPIMPLVGSPGEENPTLIVNIHQIPTLAEAVLKTLYAHLIQSSQQPCKVGTTIDSFCVW